MRINESVFRKILREEARRVLSEAEGTPPAAAPAGAVATPAGTAGAVAGPATAEATKAVADAKTAYDKVWTTADQQANRLVGINQDLGMKVKGGIYNLKDPASPSLANLQTALSQASGRGTAQGVAGSNLILLASLASGKPISDWKVAVKELGYVSALSVDTAKLDDPSQIPNPPAGLKSLISTAASMGTDFNTAVTQLISLSGALKSATATARPAAATSGAPAPGTAPKVPAAGPTKDWGGYNAKVKSGPAVQQAWSDFVVSPANKGGSKADFMSFARYYNALIKQMNVKYLSPEKMIEHLRGLIAGAPAGLAPVTPVTDTSIPSLGGGKLMGVEDNAAAMRASADQALANLRAATR